MSLPSQLPWDMIRRRATAVSHNCSNSNYNRGVGWEEAPATLAADWSADPANWSTAAATANRRYTILNNNSVNSNSSNNKANLGVWGMTKTGVGGAEGWRGRTQRRTTLFTSRDGWDSSVGWL